MRLGSQFGNNGREDIQDTAALRRFEAKTDISGPYAQPNRVTGLITIT
jgi:hypothetical protein